MLNVTRYITFRTAAASLSALAISLAAWSMDDQQAAGVPDWPGDPAGGTDHAPAEGRNADDGRSSDPHGGNRADAAVGQPQERVRVDCGPDDGGLRRGRLCRRLSEDRAPVASRPQAALQDALSGPDRRSRRHRAARARESGPLQHGPRLSVLQAAGSRSRLVVPARLRCSCWLRSRTRST